MFTRWIARMRAVFLRRRLDREMREEMATHIALATSRCMARGMSEAEARRAAQREFGAFDFIQEEARDARGGRWLELSGTAIFIDDDYFDVLRVCPVSGTLLGPADAAPAEAARVVIDHSMWQQYFGGSSDVVGRVLRVNDHPVEIAGVAPPRIAAQTMMQNRPSCCPGGSSGAGGSRRRLRRSPTPACAA